MNFSTTSISAVPDHCFFQHFDYPPPPLQNLQQYETTWDKLTSDEIYFPTIEPKAVNRAVTIPILFEERPLELTSTSMDNVDSSIPSVPLNDSFTSEEDALPALSPSSSQGTSDFPFTFEDTPDQQITSVDQSFLVFSDFYAPPDNQSVDISSPVPSQTIDDDVDSCVSSPLNVDTNDADSTASPLNLPQDSGVSLPSNPNSPESIDDVNNDDSPNDRCTAHKSKRNKRNSGANDEETKKAIKLSRNRRAAVKSRAKKKEEIRTLEEKQEALGTRNDELKSTIKRLKEELFNLRCQLIANGRCPCLARQYLMQNGLSMFTPVPTVQYLTDPSTSAPTNPQPISPIHMFQPALLTSPVASCVTGSAPPVTFHMDAFNSHQN